MRQKYILLLWLLVSGYIFYFSLICAIKFNTFAYKDFDLAVHALSAWNILHGSFFNSILGIPYLGNHMHIIMLFLIPIFAIAPHPLTLLFLQSMALGLGALPLYYLSRRILNENWALVISSVYLFFPALGYTNLFEFHPTVFATLFLTLTLYYYMQNSFIKCCVFMGLSMLCQENIPLAIIMFGVLALFNRREKKWIVAPMVMGVVYLVLALKTISHLNPNTIQFFVLYKHFGNNPVEAILNVLSKPSLFFSTLLRPQAFTYLFHTFLPVLFIPFVSPSILLPATPLFLQHLLSGRPSELTIGFHYLAEIIPFIFVSFIYGIKRMVNKGYVTHERFLKISLMATVLLSNIYLGPHFAVLRQFFIPHRQDYLTPYKNECVKSILPHSSVVATFEFLPHLTHRSQLYSLHHIYMGFYTLSSKRYMLPESPDTALIDFQDTLTFKGFYHYDNYKNLQQFLSQDKWEVEDFLEGIVLFKKGNSLSCQLSQMIQSPQKDQYRNTVINIGNEIVLLEFDRVSKSKDICEITFYWKSLKRTDKDINIFLDIVDKYDTLIQRKFLPIGYRIFPTQSWNEGEVFKDTFRIKIPVESPGSHYRLKIGFFDFRNGMLCKIVGFTDGLGRVVLTEI